MQPKQLRDGCRKHNDKQCKLTNKRCTWSALSTCINTTQTPGHLVSQSQGRDTNRVLVGWAAAAYCGSCHFASRHTLIIVSKQSLTKYKRDKRHPRVNSHCENTAETEHTSTNTAFFTLDRRQPYVRSALTLLSNGKCFRKESRGPCNTPHAHELPIQAITFCTAIVNGAKYRTCETTKSVNIM